MISCILLSAGLSTRFGTHKALAPLNKQTVIEHLQNMLVHTLIDEIIVVLGAYHSEIKHFLLKHKKVKFVYNKNYKLGQTSSFKIGFQTISACSHACFLLPVDYPFVQKETINLLIQHYHKEKPLILIPTYKGKKGHPPLFQTSLLPEIIQLQNNEGINSLAHKNLDKVKILAVKDPGIRLTFNTKKEFQNITKNNNISS